MMMNSFDLGGCCLARYGAATSYFASKTEQIMSKYRPIAPKPVAQSAAVLLESVQNQQPQPCPSSFRSSARARKRNWEAASVSASASASASGAAVPSPSPPPRPHKRAARGRAGAPDVHFEGGHNRPDRKSTVISAALRHSDTSEEAVSPHCEISDSAASKCFAYAGPSFGYSSSSAGSSTSSSFDSAFTQKNNVSLDKDTAFMERAAASASPSLNLGLHERKSSAVLSESIQPMSMVARDPSASCVLNAQLGIIPEAERDDLVTLPLLPVTPYRKESPSTSCVSNLSTKESSVSGSGNGMQTIYKDDGRHLKPDLSLSGNNKMTLAPAPVHGPLLDISLLEHMYSASCDPVIVTDDSHSHQVVWYNHAYKRAAESALASSDLGIPRPLATFTLHKHQHPALKLDNSSSVATLWGFAKKFSPAPQDKDMDSTHSRKGVVIMPQALRPVGSSVLVECITDTNSEASPLCGVVEEIEEQFEAENWPVLISDSNNRVRWANSAYKQMVGQPECSWLEFPATSATGNTHSHSPKAMRINGEVVLIFQLPQSAAAFSCRVKIQWTNGTEKSSMTVPCDVVRSDGDLKDCFYVWKFDVQAALCL